MVHLKVGDEGMIESVFWRFGPRSKTVDNAWDDWRRYSEDRYKAATGTDDELYSQTLRQWSAVTEVGIVPVIALGVEKGLGVGLSSERTEELEDRMKRVGTKLQGGGKRIGRIVVVKRLRRSRHVWVPSVHIQVQCVEDNEQDLAVVKSGGEGSRDGIRDGNGVVHATIIVDRTSRGGLRTMTVMYAGEEPIVRIYRSKYPPPELEASEGSGGKVEHPNIGAGEAGISGGGI
jgi:hypothetical protein